MVSTNTLIAGALAASFGDTVRRSTVGAVFGNPQAFLQAISPAFGVTVRRSTVSAVFGNPQALLQAFGTVFRQRIERAEGFECARFGFAEQRLGIALRQGERARG